MRNSRTLKKNSVQQQYQAQNHTERGVLQEGSHFGERVGTLED